MPDQPTHWAVAVAAPQQVDKVVEQLISSDLPHFYPRVRRTVRHRGRRVVRFSPLLFNYVPVCLEDDMALSAVLNLRGVVDVIGPLASQDVGRLRAVCGSDGVYTPKPVARFKPGQRVKAATGPFEGVVGRFERCEDDAAHILIHSFGRMVSVGFELGNLVAA